MRNELVVQNQLVSYIIERPIKPELPTVVLLHGWRSEAALWNDIIKGLDASLYNIIAMDLPGFGKSEKLKKDFTVSDYSEVVKQFCEKLHLSTIYIVGHSFGGRVGIKLAGSGDKQFQKLVLIDSAGFVDSSGRKSLLGFIAKVVRPLFKPSFMQPLRHFLYKTMGAEDYVATPELQRTFVNLIGEDLTEDMKRITTPTLIVFGEKDVVTPPDFGKQMHSLIHNSQFHILMGAGHFSFLEKPAQVLQLINEFISR